MLQDPIVDFKPQVEAVTNTSGLMLLIYPKELFKGPSWDLTSAKEVYATVKRRLNELMRETDPETQSHLSICNDPEFSLRCLVTEPHRKAINAVSMHNGWQPEAVYHGFCANVGWMENVKTRLVDNLGAHHLRTPNMAASVGLSNSRR